MPPASIFVEAYEERKNDCSSCRRREANPQRGTSRKSIESERQKKRTAQLAHNVNWRKNGVNTAAPKIDLTNITNKDAKRFTFFEKKFIISS